MWETTKNFDEYFNDIKQKSMLVVNDCKVMGKLHHYELIGLIATTVAQYELRIFNHFLKINNLVTRPYSENTIHIPKEIIWSGQFEKLERQEQKVYRVKSEEIIHADKLAELLGENAETVIKNLLNDRWNKYIVKIISKLNTNNALSWFIEAREMRHQLVHSLEKDMGTPFDNSYSNNLTKQNKTIFDAKSIMWLAFGVDNFSLQNMSFSKPFSFPPILDEVIPCHLSRYIEKNQNVFGFIANYNELSANGYCKMLLSAIVGRDDVQHYKVPQDGVIQKIMFTGGTEIFGTINLQNKEYYDESIFAQMLHSDLEVMQKCGVNVEWKKGDR